MSSSTKKSKGTGGAYFASPIPSSDIEFIPTGCTLLNLALGGGWAEGRIANIVGDKSTGKTLLCIEACANFAVKYPKGKIYYRECEAAFDRKYAADLGMPLDRVDFSQPLETVEDMFEDLERIISRTRRPALYILDSLDALSDRAELDRSMDQGTYGAQKAKNLSQLFRRLVRKIEHTKITILIVSQVRSKIGVMAFGRKTTRSGGKALDFYATHVLYLAHIKTLTKRVRGIKHAIGVRIRVKMDKNKIARPFAEAEFMIKFGFGADDAEACLNWLKETKSPYLKKVGDVNKYLAKLEISDEATYQRRVKRLRDAVVAAWYEIQTQLSPSRKKYGTATK